VSSSPTEYGRDTSSAARPGVPGDGPAADSTTAVTMPQMGVSVAEGTIVAWLKQPGEEVGADEPLCEVTTDKIDVEIPSPAAGVLTEILVEPGETVKVGTLLARIGGGEPASEEPAANGTEPAPEKRGGEIDRSSFVSPVVRRIAEERGIDLAAVRGHGVGGRVRKADLLEYVRAHGEDAAHGSGNGDGNGNGNGHRDRPLHSESPYREEPATATAPSGAGDLTGPSRRVEMDPMRKAIARHMVESRRTAAHCSTVIEADFSAVAAARRELKEPMARRGVPLTYLAFVARATVEALGEFPALNASVEEDAIVLHEDINLGIAVALDDGLVVPVIRKAQRLSLEGMAAEIAELAARAREGSLAPDDVHGGTFTITNPGQFGALIATPIINQPQVAILDLEAIERRPVVVDDGAGGESIGIRPMSYLCMSWDHRALDGALAARFLSRVRELITEGELR
jgi:pyruvate/2-oxoglutarate dehydrogenase complex dihydrolipoamide acyltransferase (E2) component